ncbi:MAG: TetR/AcrR family transcriptional regulator, partial [Spirochaetia bacterium]|nr:TetR/AcrR family transcriptional regulator [Spirochaetia bacterium]
AALAILAEEGYQALSLRKAARRAGVSQTAPYRHYPDLESLYADVAAEGFKLLTAKLAKIRVRYAAHPLLQFRKSGVAYVEFALEYPDLFQIMYGNQIQNHSRHTGLVESEEATFNVLVDILTHCRDAGIIRADPVRKAAVSAWTMVHGVAVLLSGKQVMFRDADLRRARAITKDLIQHLYVGMRR